MREAILAVVVVGFAIAGVINPRIGILAWVWYAVMRPDFLVFAARDNNYSTLLAGATMIGSVRYLPEIRTWIRNPICLGLILLVGLAFVSQLSPVLKDKVASDRFTIFWRMMLIILFIPMLLKTITHLRAFLMVMAFSIGVVGLKFGLFGLLHGGVRFATGFGGFMSDNNALASAMVTLLPLCWYARRLTESKWLRILLLCMTLTMVSTVVMTYSRGGAIGVVVVFALILFRSKKRLQLALVLAGISIIPLYMVGKSYTDRLATLQTPEEETSARSRMVFATAAIEMWKDYPFFGVGFGMRSEQVLIKKYVQTYTDEDVDYGSLVLHNTYLQTLVDCGLFAFLAYAGTLFGTIIWLGFEIRRTRREHPGFEFFPMAIQTGLLGFCVTSTFLSEMHVDFIYILTMAAAVWRECRYALPSVPSAQALDNETLPADDSQLMLGPAPVQIS